MELVAALAVVFVLILVLMRGLDLVGAWLRRGRSGRRRAGGWS